MRYSVNVSILYKEYPFVERFARARADGFSAVEFWWPSGEDLGAVEQAVKDSGLQAILINFDAGDMPAGDRGLVSDPKRQQAFRDNVPVALGLADRLGCKMMNALLGVRVPELSVEEQIAVARDNIIFAADLAAKQGATIMIEAVNTIENGAYLIHTTKDASEFKKSIGRENVKLQYDAYHMQRMEGNIVATIEKNFGDIGHIQIADSPGRGEPGTGEIHYPYIFRKLEELNYDGYIGLEYKPFTGKTEESLGWLSKDARGGDVGSDSLTIY